MRWRRFTGASVSSPGRNAARKLAVDHAIEHSFVREAVVPERKLLTEALKRGHWLRHRRGRETRGATSVR